MNHTLRKIMPMMGMIIAFALLLMVVNDHRNDRAGMPQHPVPTSSQTAQHSFVDVRQIHTPAILVDDMHLNKDQCEVRVISAEQGLVLPDPECTPGAIDPSVTQDNIKGTICKAGWTKNMRPPSSVTNKAKMRSLKAYSIDYDKTIEFDHLVPLSLGGASSISNLWPEPNEQGATSFANPKDLVAEQYLNAAVCAGLVPLAQAQNAVADDWTSALDKLNLSVRDDGASICRSRTLSCTSTGWGSTKNDN